MIHESYASRFVMIQRIMNPDQVFDDAEFESRIQIKFLDESNPNHESESNRIINSERPNLNHVSES